MSVTKTTYVGGPCPPPIPAVIGSAGLTVRCVPVPMSVCPTCVECVDDNVSTLSCSHTMCTCYCVVTVRAQVVRPLCHMEVKIRTV